MIRRLLLGLTATAALLAVLYLVGPVHRLDTAVAPITMPADPLALEAQLQEGERRFGDVTPGTEKRIRWAYADRRRTPIAIVYLHGFSATRQEVDPLCDELAAELGANLFLTRLSGHGRSSAAMAEATGNDWLRDAKEALAVGRSIGERVIVIGTSTGGTLAVWLAQQADADSIAAQVLISPNFGSRDPRSDLLAGPWGAELLALTVGEERSWTPQSAEHARYWTSRYPSKAVLPVIALVREVRDSDLSTVRTPTLTIYSPHDRVVDPQRIVAAHAQLGAQFKPLQAIERSQDPSQHVLAGRILAPDDTPRIRGMILDFLSSPAVGIDQVCAGCALKASR